MGSYGIDDILAFNQRKRESTELVYFMEWNGILLNVTFISPKLALMCTPSTTDAYKRNDVRIIADFIHERCGAHFYLVNLHEPSYDPSLFDNQVLYFPCPDHCAPQISFFDRVTAAMSEIEDADPGVTFFIHCKAGRGRSGMVLAAYQLHRHIFSSAAEAIANVNTKRSPDQIGISIPSQARFLRYFERVCKLGHPPKRRTQPLSIEFQPGMAKPLEFFVSPGIPLLDPDGTRHPFDGNLIQLRDEQLAFENEFFVRIWEPGTETDIIRLQLHSDFLTEEMEKVEKLENSEFRVLFEKAEIEGPHHRKTGKTFPHEFRMVLLCRLLEI
jgi:hypothetical protein